MVFKIQYQTTPNCDVFLLFGEFINGSYINNEHKKIKKKKKLLSIIIIYFQIGEYLSLSLSLS